MWRQATDSKKIYVTNISDKTFESRINSYKSKHGFQFLKSGLRSELTCYQGLNNKLIKRHLMPFSPEKKPVKTIA